MRVIILAAGYGTRLYPRTKNLPKPLLKIGNKPIINYLLDKVEELDNLSHIVVVSNNRFFRHFQRWKKSLNIKHRLYLLNDLSTSPMDKLGAIGDMYFAFNKEKFSGNFLVLGGDNIFRGDLKDFIRFARSKGPFASVGLFDLGNKKEARHYGVVSLDKNKRISSFYEKPLRPKSSLVAMCLYYFPKEKLGLMKEYLNNPLNSRDAAGSYINWLINRDRVYGFIFKDFWIDIGHMHTYKKVEKSFGK